MVSRSQKPFLSRSQIPIGSRAQPLIRNEITFPVAYSENFDPSVYFNQNTLNFSKSGYNIEYHPNGKPKRIYMPAQQYKQTYFYKDKTNNYTIYDTYIPHELLFNEKGEITKETRRQPYTEIYDDTGGKVYEKQIVYDYDISQWNNNKQIVRRTVYDDYEDYEKRHDDGSVYKRKTYLKDNYDYMLRLKTHYQEPTSEFKDIRTDKIEPKNYKLIQPLKESMNLRDSITYYTKTPTYEQWHTYNQYQDDIKRYDAQKKKYEEELNKYKENIKEISINKFIQNELPQLNISLPQQKDWITSNLPQSTIGQEPMYNKPSKDSYKYIKERTGFLGAINYKLAKATTAKIIPSQQWIEQKAFDKWIETKIKMDKGEIPLTTGKGMAKAIREGKTFKEYINENYGYHLGIGTVQGIRDKPVTEGIYLTLTALGTPMISGTKWALLRYAPSITKIPAIAQTGQILHYSLKSLPYLYAGAKTYEIAMQPNIQSKLQKTGEIIGTEITPLTAGSIIGTKLSTPIEMKISLEKTIQDLTPEKQKLFRNLYKETQKIDKYRVTTRNYNFKELEAFRNDQNNGHKILQKWFSKHPDAIIGGSGINRAQMDIKSLKTAKLPQDIDPYFPKDKQLQYIKEISNLLKNAGYNIRITADGLNINVIRNGKSIHLMKAHDWDNFHQMISEAQGIKGALQKTYGTLKTPDGSTMLDIKLQAQRNLIRAMLQGKTQYDIKKAWKQYYDIMRSVKNIQAQDKTYKATSKDYLKAFLKGKKGGYYNPQETIKSYDYHYITPPLIGIYPSIQKTTPNYPTTYHYKSTIPTRILYPKTKQSDYPIIPSITYDTLQTPYKPEYLQKEISIIQPPYIPNVPPITTLPPSTISQQYGKPKQHSKTITAYQPIYITKQGKEIQGKKYKTKNIATQTAMNITDKYPIIEFMIQKVNAEPNEIQTGTPYRKIYKFRSTKKTTKEKRYYQYDTKNEKGINIIPFIFAEQQY